MTLCSKEPFADGSLGERLRGATDDALYWFGNLQDYVTRNCVSPSYSYIQTWGFVCWHWVHT